MGRTVIELENVTKYYDSHIGRSGGLKNLLLNFAKSEAECKRYTVLENLSFKIEEGTSTAIVGRNGVGKSTLLSIIAGVLLPSSGKVRVSGKVSSLLELGAGFHPDLTGRENVRLYGMLLGFSKKMILERVEAIKEFSELGDFFESPTRYYSSGMMARLGFSVASQLDPEILLVDEVLAVGDFSFRDKCLDVMRKYRQQQKTILLVSHSANDVMQFCQRAIWIKDRKIMADGPSHEVCEAYMGKKLKDPSLANPDGTPTETTKQKPHSNA